MRRFLLVVLAAAVSAAFLLGAAASASAGTLDQQQTNTSGSGLDAESTQTIAQTFTAGLSGKLDQVDLHLGKLNGPTAPLSIELRDVSGGLPGSTILASQSVPQPSVPASPRSCRSTSPCPHRWQPGLSMRSSLTAQARSPRRTTGT